VGDDAKAAVVELIAGAGAGVNAGPASTDGRNVGRGDLARASLFALARHPALFRTGAKEIAGVPYAAMYPILEEAPRYLHWLGGQGLLGTVHPWCAVVAADLGRRIKWRHLGPSRGAGRLLWMCEQMATPLHHDETVPQLWTAATTRGLGSPDWSSNRAPAGCQLSEDDYHALLRERGTSCTVVWSSDSVRATGPAGSVLTVWNAGPLRRTPVRSGRAEIGITAEQDAEPGAAVFTWRGDHLATGWLTAYAEAAL